MRCKHDVHGEDCFECYPREAAEVDRLRSENSLLRSALAEVGRIHGRWITNEIDEYVAMDEISEQVTLAASKTSQGGSDNVSGT